MRCRRWRLRFAGAFLALGALVSAACSSGDEANDGSRAATGSDVSIEVVTHGQATDPFWSVVKKGIDDAAVATGATVNYTAPATFDMARMSRLIDAAVARRPDGIAISVPDYDALAGAIARVNDAGIPLVTINSGSDVLSRTRAVSHIGQDERVAGHGAGARLAANGATTIVCVHHEIGNAGLDERCDGARAAVEELGGRLEVLPVDRDDAARARSTIAARLQSDQDVDALLALGPTGASAALAALNDLGRDDVQLATFDLSPEVLDAIDAGTMAFAVDQQQYVQGYLAIVFLQLHAANLNTVGGGRPVLTGPGFVTPDNVAQVRDLAAAGSR